MRARKFHFRKYKEFFSGGICLGFLGFGLKVAQVALKYTIVKVLTNYFKKRSFTKVAGCLLKN